MKKMLHFLEATHEGAETVIFRQYVPDNMMTDKIAYIP